MQVFRRAVFGLFALLLTVQVGQAQSVSEDRLQDQPGYVAKKWTKSSGLPQDIVWALEQGRSGALWVGTLDGLARFDGHSFKQFNAAEIDGLVGNRITVLHQHSDGSLWIGTETGLSVLRDGRFRQLLRGHRINGLEEGSTGTVWVVVRRGGDHPLYRSTATGIEPVPLPDTLGAVGLVEPASPDSVWIRTRGSLFLHDGRSFERPQWAGSASGLTDRDIRHLESGPDGKIWVATDSHLFSIGSSGETVDRYPYNAGQIEDIEFGPSGDLWVTTSESGLYRVSERGERKVQAGGALPAALRELERDESGQWWIGTHGDGLFRLRHRLFQDVDLGLPDSPAARAIQAIGEESVWVSLARKGLVKIPSNGGRTTHWTRRDGLPDNTVWSLAPSAEGRLAIGAVGGSGSSFAWHKNGQFELVRRPQSKITALERDSSGTLWIAGPRVGLYRHRSGRIERALAPDSLSFSRVLALHPASDGALWIGLRSEGAVRLKDGQLTRYDTDDGLPHRSVRDIYETTGGTIWVSTYGGGVARFEGEAFTPVTPKDRLPTGTINALYEAPEGILWMTSNEGVFRVPLKQLEAVADGRRDRLYPRVFGPADGMPDAECNGPFHPAIAEDSRGRLWIPTMDGPTVVDPYRKAFSVPDSIPVRVTEVRVDGTSRPPDSLRLAPSAYRLAFDFTAVSLRHGSDLSFRYRLDGGEWRPARSRRTAQYTGLNAGTHRFEVQATLDGQTWYRLASPLEITVAPHLYQTWWFWLLMGTGLLGVALGAYRWRTDQLRRRQQELETAVEARTEKLKRRTEKLRQRTEELSKEKEKTERQAERLAELDETKSRFLAYLSHEIRTPITLILGPLKDALSGRYGSIPEALRDRLRTMENQAGRLRSLTNRLLDLSELEEGEMELEARPIEPERFLRRMADDFSREAGQKDLRIRVEVDERPGLCADPGALEQILANLLSNALEHAPEGSDVVLRASPAEKPPNPEGTDRGGGPMTAISVRDAGPGFPEELKGRLFDPYASAAGGEGSCVDVGTGIGLALTREYARRHGGAVVAESEDGAGTEITVYLPQSCGSLPSEDRAEKGGAEQETEAELRSLLTIGDGAPQASPGPDARSGEGDRPTVLVVDDESSVCDYLQDVLAPRYAVRTAADGEEGLAAARNERPALVISDVEMPEIDGFELCRALREDKDLRAVPIILLTVRGDDESELEGLQHGADAYVSKPFNPETLRQRAENLVHLRQFLRGHGSEGTPEGPPPARADERDSGSTTKVAPDSWPGDGSGDGREGGPFVTQLQSVVEEHLDNSGFGVEWLADEAGLSRRQLQRRIQDETGLTAGAFIRAVRLKQAARLLQRGDVETVAEAAEAIGYRDSSHFSRLFEDAFGHSPAEVTDHQVS